MSHRAIRVLALGLLLAVGASGTALAQGIGVGVKGGLVYPDFSVDLSDYNYNSKTGWQAGMWFGGNRDGIVGVQVEINYLQKKGETQSGNGDFTINYLQVPILLRLNTPAQTKNSFQLYGVVGPSFDFKVSDSFNGINLIDEFEGTDVGIMGGVGIDVARIIVEGRYTYGLRQINKSFSDVAELKSHAFALLFGVRFN
jgi:hypothetical protein